MRRIAALFVSLLLLPLLTTSQSALASSPAQGRSSAVFIVLAPYVTWDDIRSPHLARLGALAKDSALGNLNVRSRAPEAEQGSLTQAALMMSAGSWAIEDPGAPDAYSLDEGYETGDVAEAYRRFMGASPTQGEIAYLGLPRAQRANDFETIDTVLGSLGSAVKGAGGITAAVGNSDTGFSTGAIGRDRPAALVAMDEMGLVDAGDVSRALIDSDENGPWGVSTDLEALEEALDDVIERADSAKGPSLVVVDPGDLHRAVEFADMVSADVAQAHWRQALTVLDAVVEMVTERMPEDAVLIVVAPVPDPPEEGRPWPLAPCIVHGPGWEPGFLTAPSTHRTGLAALTDVPATVLDAMGVEPPLAMMGSPMVSEASSLGFDERVEQLVADDASAVALDAAKRPVLNAFIALTVLLIVGATLMVMRDRYPKWAARGVQWGLIGVLSVPVASYLMFAVKARPGSEWLAVGLLLAATAVVWAASMATGLAEVRAPLLFVSGLTAVVLLADPWLGSPLSFTGFLSYSPLGGARYYGLGNEAAGLLFGSVAVALGLAVDRGGEMPWVRALARWGVPLIGAFVVWTTVAPGLGANVGVAIWGVVTFGVLWAALNGIKFGWKTVAAILVVVILVLAVAVVLDARGEGTHLARFVGAAERGGLEQAWTMIERKIETNLRVLTATNWTWVLIAVLGLLAVMRWKPRGEFMEALREAPGFAQAMTALLWGGLFAYFSEDSGIVIPALMLLYPGVGVLFLMLERRRAEGGEART